MKKIKSILFSFVTTSVLFLLFGGSMAYATFIENDFDTITSKALVYNSWWFNLLFIIAILHLIGSLFYNKVFKLKKWSILLFHLAFISMFLGSAITRFYSFEGIMHIRKSEKSNFISSSDYYLSVESLNSNNEIVIHDSKHILSPYVYVNFNDNYVINDKKVSLKGNNYFSNAVEAAMFKEDGTPAITLFINDSLGTSQRIILQKGGYYKTKLVSFGYESDIKTDLSFTSIDEKLFIETEKEVEYYNMFKDGSESIILNKKDSVSTSYLYNFNGSNINIKSFKSKANVKTFSMKGQDQHNSVLNALILDVAVDDVEEQFTLFVDSRNGKSFEKFISINGLELRVSYGKKKIVLPFYVQLNDFILDRYVGSDMPSSFKSLVTIKDELDNKSFDYEIFMNNILDYKGYRFFQSSYDKDELGTVLSVNYDYWGTMVTYLGYLLMTIGITFSIINPRSRLVYLLKKSAKRAKESKVASLVVLFVLLGSNSLLAQHNPNDGQDHSGHAHAQKQVKTPVSPLVHNHNHEFVLPRINEDVAKHFGELLVVDLKGRLKPLHTLGSEILRKISRTNGYMGLDASQVIMDMAIYPENWKNAPLIKIKSEKLKGLLKTKESKVSFNTIAEATLNGKNIISQYSEIATNKLASDRDAFDKDILKVSERTNILYLVFSSDIFKIMPDKDCSSCEWISVRGLMSLKESEAKDLYGAFVGEYTNLESGFRWKNSYAALDKLHSYQKEYSSLELPSSLRIKSEIWYNNTNLFPKLAISYFMLGFVLLVLTFVKLLNSKLQFTNIMKGLKGLLLLTFGMHAFTFFLRWYIAGYAPMSNGYETILFIALITMLSGIIFSSRSQITYAISSILASILLLVASLSYFDPEITNQAPVLKSVWLVIHVAIITMSYGFFGISALLGIFNLFIYLFRNNKNKAQLDKTLDELTDVIEISIIIGLYFLTIGTFLGAVWANESWGRYWGWDPKETWALITVLVYAIYVHMRKTKYFRGNYSASVSAVFAISSVLMTYFGVNYFLSGLHSYAGDGPSNIPTWVYYAAVSVIVLAITAFIKHKKVPVEKIKE